MCFLGNLSSFICLPTLLWSMRVLFSGATTAHLFDFWVSVSDQHSTLPIRVASLFALGTWPLFPWPGKWLCVLVFPDFVEVHAVGGVCFFGRWGKFRGPLWHRCPDGPSVRWVLIGSALSHHEAKSLCIALPPTFGESRILRAQSNPSAGMLPGFCLLTFS